MMVAIARRRPSSIPKRVGDVCAKSWYSARLWAQVEAHLQQKWSLEQISAVLRQEDLCRVRHEDKQGDDSLYEHTRTMPKQRRKRYHSKDSRGVLSGKRYISTRDAAINERREMGYCDGDTVIGSDTNHCILTLPERNPRFALSSPNRFFLSSTYSS